MNKKTFTLGIFGGGQLGKFLVQSAKKLNIRTFVFTDSFDSPAIYHSDDFIISNYKNKKKLDFFIKNIDLATFEFENIPFQTLDYVEKKNYSVSKTFNNKNSSRQVKRKKFFKFNRNKNN